MTEQRIAELEEKLANVRRFRDEAARRPERTWGGSTVEYWDGRMHGLGEALEAFRAELAERYDGPERRAHACEATEQVEWAREALDREADAYDRLQARYDDRGDVLTERERELTVMTEQADMLGSIASDLYNELEDALALASEARTVAFEDN